MSISDCGLLLPLPIATRDCHTADRRAFHGLARRGIDETTSDLSLGCNAGIASSIRRGFPKFLIDGVELLRL